MMSDSRLSGGKFWDYGPKIFSIGRSDAVIAFSGDTAWTYPLIAQISSYVESFVNLRDRIVDLTEAYDLVLRMLNESIEFVSSPAHPSLELPDCSFILAGYSSFKKDFFIRRIDFHPKQRRFKGRLTRKICGEPIALIGDRGPVGALARSLSEYQTKRGKGTRSALDMAPAKAFFEVACSGQFTEIGGAPQLAKVYENMTQAHLGVYWPPELPVEEQDIYLRGRRLGKFDVLDHPWVYEPSSANLYWHDFSPDEVRARASARAKVRSAP